MTVQMALVDAVCCCIRNRRAQWPADALTAEQWDDLLGLARDQKMIPMVLHSTAGTESFAAQDPGFCRMLQAGGRQMVAQGARRSLAMAALWLAMERAGIRCVIMKGAACSATYPAGSLRISSDEDLLVPEEQFADCIAFLQAQGFTFTQESCDETSFEVGMERPDGLYLELHRTPFAPDDPVLGGCNAWFDGYADRAMDIHADGVQLRVLGPQDHMLLLIIHAFKHLLGSGLGLRQVCDMLLWAERYGAQIDWPTVAQRCRSVRALGFAAAAFRLGALYLEFDAEKAGLEDSWTADDAVAQQLLDDLLGGGIYGKATLSRVHSSTITLNAVAADRSGERSSLLRTVFPSRSRMEKTYPYVQRMPLLLPLAWAHRLVRYGAEVTHRQDSSVSDSVRLGNDRTALLRKLDVLD